MSERIQGKCKWFSDTKGFGFIVAEGYNRDIFVHKQQIVKSGLTSLAENEPVSFVVNDGKKGLFATEIVKVNADANRPH